LVRAPVAHEGPRLVVERNRLAGPEALLVELVGRELGVAEVRLPGQHEMEVAKAPRNPARALVVRPIRLVALATGGDRMALAQDAQNLLVARVVPRRDVLDCLPERQTPREQVLPLDDGLHGESVPLEDRVADREAQAIALYLGPRLQPPRGYRHVVAGSGQSPDLAELSYTILGVQGSFSLISWISHYQTTRPMIGMLLSLSYDTK
jgi:hypothetical protein